MNYDVTIVGGGAAGLMCAVEAGKRGRKVLVIEHGDRIGRKILISGGGRCNFTNLHTSPDKFLSSNPHFAKSALARYGPERFIALVEKHGITYYEKELGQLFCRGSAREITKLLTTECEAAGVEIALTTAVETVARDDQFRIKTADREISSAALVIATGGLSIPKIGATGFGYDIARQFGHQIVPPEPALVPLLWAPTALERYRHLSGVSFGGRVSIDSTVFDGKVLFTHRGLSGPAILQISSYWHPGDTLRIDLFPGVAFAEQLKSRRMKGERTELKNVLTEFLPKRFAESWVELPGATKPLASLSDKELASLSAELHDWRIVPDGTEGFGKAEVTGGGVDTREISSKSFESARVPGLYFIGEVLDVTGHLGGYNFQWAWASGFACGQVV